MRSVGAKNSDPLSRGRDPSPAAALRRRPPVIEAFDAYGAARGHPPPIELKPASPVAKAPGDLRLGKALLDQARDQPPGLVRWNQPGSVRGAAGDEQNATFRSCANAASATPLDLEDEGLGKAGNRRNCPPANAGTRQRQQMAPGAARRDDPVPIAVPASPNAPRFIAGIGRATRQTPATPEVFEANAMRLRFRQDESRLDR